MLSTGDAFIEYRNRATPAKRAWAYLPSIEMIPLSINDVPIGKPVEWRLWDAAGHLILSKGCVVPEMQDAALLFLHGSVLRDPEEPTSGDPESRSAIATETIAQVPDPAYGDMGFDVSSILQVIQAGPASAHKASCRIIGFVNHQALFITTPTARSVPLRCQPGDVLLLRGFSGRTIQSFMCTVESVCVTLLCAILCYRRLPRFKHFPLEGRSEYLRDSLRASMQRMVRTARRHALR